LRGRVKAPTTIACVQWVAYYAPRTDSRRPRAPPPAPPPPAGAAMANTALAPTPTPAAARAAGGGISGGGGGCWCWWCSRHRGVAPGVGGSRKEAGPLPRAICKPATTILNAAAAAAAAAAANRKNDGGRRVRRNCRRLLPFLLLLPVLPAAAAASVAAAAAAAVVVVGGVGRCVCGLRAATAGSSSAPSLRHALDRSDRSTDRSIVKLLLGIVKIDNVCEYITNHSMKKYVCVCVCLGANSIEARAPPSCDAHVLAFAPLAAGLGWDVRLMIDWALACVFWVRPPDRSKDRRLSPHT
jgi:hypothetical protein